MKSIPLKPWLAGIALLYLMFALPGLSEQGVFMFDEARSLVEGRELRWNLKWAGAYFTGNPSIFGGMPPYRPSFAIGEMSKPAMLALHAVLGTPSAALHAQAITGLVSVAIVVAIGGIVFDREQLGGREALIATGVLIATSPSHLFFSRTLLPDVNSGAVIMFCLLILLKRSHDAGRYGYGVLCGVGFLIHPRFAFALPALILVDVVRQRRVVPGVRSLAGFCIPLIATELFFQALRVGVQGEGLPWEFGAYFDRLGNYLRLGSGGFRLSRPFFGIEYIAETEGFGLIAVFLLGVVVAAIRGRTMELVLACFAVYLVMVGSLFEERDFPGQRLGRMIYPAIPIIILVASAGVSEVVRVRSIPGIALVIIAATSMAIQRAPLLMEIRDMKSDHQEIIETAVARSNASLFLSDRPYHGILHVGHERYARWASPRTDTICVAIFDESRRKRMRFSGILPDTPAFSIVRNHRPSRLERREVFRGDFVEAHSTGERPEVNVYILPPSVPSSGDPRILWL